MIKFCRSRNIKRKGALFIEYALVLALVIVVGVMFISDGGIKNSIASIFGKTSETLEVAVNGGEKKPAKRFDSNDYYTLVTGSYGIDKAQLATKFTSGTLITSGDEAGIQALKEAGINIPEGEGNWSLAVINSSGDYKLTWMPDGKTIKNATNGDNVLMYVSNEGYGHGQYTTAKAELDSNGKIISAGNKQAGSQFYSVLDNTDLIASNKQSYTWLVTNQIKDIE